MDSHDYRVDRLRVLCCFGVVLLHSSAGAGTGDLILNALFRFSVPVFVIISGYFMLARPASPADMAKRAGALFIKLLGCSAFYLLANQRFRAPLPQVLEYLLTSPVHLWYLYATMGLYLLTPGLMPFVRSAERAEYRYALGICFLLGCCGVTLMRLDVLPLVGTILDKSKLPTMLAFVGMYLLGGYFRRFGFGNRSIWLVVFLCASVFQAAVCQTPQAGTLLSFIAPTVVLSGGACFALCMMLPDVSERLRPVMRAASECTMGVYLLHFYVSDRITPWLRQTFPLPGTAGPMLLRAVTVFLVTMALVRLLRKLPFVGRIFL